MEPDRYRECDITRVECPESGAVTTHVKYEASPLAGKTIYSAVHELHPSIDETGRLDEPQLLLQLDLEAEDLKLHDPWTGRGGNQWFSVGEEYHLERPVRKQRRVGGCTSMPPVSLVPRLRAFLIRKEDGAMLQLFESDEIDRYDALPDTRVPNPHQPQAGGECHTAWAEMSCEIWDRHSDLRTRPLGLPQIMWHNRVYLAATTEDPEEEEVPAPGGHHHLEEGEPVAEEAVEVQHAVTGIRIAIKEPAAQAGSYHQEDDFAHRPGPSSVAELLSQFESCTADPFLLAPACC